MQLRLQFLFWFIFRTGVVIGEFTIAREYCGEAGGLFQADDYLDAGGVDWMIVYMGEGFGAFYADPLMDDGKGVRY